MSKATKQLTKLAGEPTHVRLKELMAMADVSQAGLAELTGRHTQSVHYWVSPSAEHRREPNRESLGGIYQALEPLIDGLELWHVTGDELDRR